MYRSRADQYFEDNEYDEPAEACPKDAYRSEGHARNCMDLATAKARHDDRPEPVRVYQCTDPSKACWLKWHLTSKR